MRRLAAATAMAVALLAGSTIGTTSAGATPSFTLTGLSGNDRYETAATVSAIFSNGAPAVVLARSEPGAPDADALSASFVAGNKPAPILLTAAAGLPQITETRIDQLKPETVILMGGTSAISSTVESVLRTKGYKVQRIQGADRYGTAAAAALLPEVSTAVIDGKLTAFLARSEGLTSPDALAAGPPSFASKIPVLLTTAATTPAVTLQAITDRGIQQLFLLGGTEAITAAQESALNARGITTVRFAGSNRSATSVAIARDLALAKLGFDRTHINLARGDESADALAAGPHGGMEKSPLLVTETSCALDRSTVEFLSAQSPHLVGGHVFGGENAVCSAVRAEAQSAGRGEAVAPAGPSAVRYAVTNASPSVTFTISGSPTPSVASYSIYRTAGATTCPAFGASYTKVGSVQDSTPGSGDTAATQTFVDSTVAATTAYCYAVTAVSASGIESSAFVFGPVTSGGTGSGSSTAPQPPASLSYSVSAGSSAVTFTVGDSPTPQVTSYNAYRTTVTGGSCPAFGAAYAKVGSVADGSPGAGSTGAVSFVDQAAAATTYCYAFTSVTSGGESAALVIGPITTGSSAGGGGGGGGNNTTQPPATMSFATTSGSSTVAITIGDSPTASTTVYDIYRAAASAGGCPAFGSFTKLATVNDASPGTGSSGTITYNDSTAAAQTSYCYAATATSPSGTSTPLILGPVTSGGGTTASTAPPAQVQWGVVGGSSSVTLTITDSPTAGVTHFNVRRVPATSGSACPTTGYGAPVQVANTSESTQTYVDSTTASATTYCYSVTAVGPAGESTPIYAGPLTTPTATTTTSPQPPASLFYTFFGNSRRVELSIGESPTTTVDQYRVYRRVVATGDCPAFSSSTWTQAATVLDNNSGPYSVSDTGTTASTRYCYAVTAVDDGLESSAFVVGPFTVGTP